MTVPHLGTPVELPWWVFVLSLPPLGVIVGAVVVGGQLAVRMVAVLASVGLIAVMTRVSRRVVSVNLQSVWVSAAYAVWFFVALLWVVAAVSGLTR